jgi:Protein of unknown function (DUF1524)
MTKGLVLGLLSFLCSASYALDQLPGNKFYLISQLSPPTNQLDLLELQEHDLTPPQPTEKYARDHHFGSWIDFSSEPSCLTTRGLVLARDTTAPIEVYPDDPCYVLKGKWWDPYTNKQFVDAKKVQVDHVVPLKEAYIAGAYKWSWKKRCAYSNFLGNNYHLIAVDGPTNTQKSDQGPDRWMPPNQQFHCEYVSHWLHIKAIWNLMLSEDEVLAIRQVIKSNRCDPSLFKMSSRELTQQRAAIADIERQCPATAQPWDGSN